MYGTKDPGRAEVLAHAQLQAWGDPARCHGLACMVGRDTAPKPKILYPAVKMREPCDLSTEAGRFEESCRSYGSKLAVWKVIAGGVESLTFASFVRGIRKLRYHGRLKTLWEQLNAGEAPSALLVAESRVPYIRWAFYRHAM